MNFRRRVLRVTLVVGMFILCAVPAMPRDTSGATDRLEMIADDQAPNLQAQPEGTTTPPGNDAESAEQGRRPLPPKRPDPVGELKQQIIQTQNKEKLGFSKVVLCSDIEGYGLFTPVKPGEKTGKLKIYIEPANIGMLVNQERYVIDCSMHIEVTDQAGKVVSQLKNVARVHKTTRSPVFDTHFAVDMNFQNPLKADHKVKFILMDNVKGQKAILQLNLNVNKNQGGQLGT
jgi:hypothetical protein